MHKYYYSPVRLVLNGTLTIPAIVGEESQLLLQNSNDVFKRYILLHDGLNKGGAVDKIDVPGHETPKQKVRIWDQYKIANCKNELFHIEKEDYNGLIETKCFTQAQVIKFCKMYPAYLNPNGYTFFPFFGWNRNVYLALVRLEVYHNEMDLALILKHWRNEDIVQFSDDGKSPNRIIIKI